MGKYFSHYNGNYFVPNEELAKLYPEDTLELIEKLAEKVLKEKMQELDVGATIEDSTDKTEESKILDRVL